MVHHPAGESISTDDTWLWYQAFNENDMYVNINCKYNASNKGRKHGYQKGVTFWHTLYFLVVKPSNPTLISTNSFMQEQRRIDSDQNEEYKHLQCLNWRERGGTSFLHFFPRGTAFPHFWETWSWNSASVVWTFLSPFPVIIYVKNCHQKPDFMAKIYQIQFRLGLRLRRSPDFESQASELQTYRRKTEFNAIQGHSKSRVLESVERRQGTK